MLILNNFTIEKEITMSELPENAEKRGEALYEFARRLIEGENGRMLFDEFRPVTQNVTPAETMAVFDQLLQKGYVVDTVKANVGKIINVFYQSLDAFFWQQPEEKHFLSYLMMENRAMENLIQEVKPFIKILANPVPDNHPKALDQIKKFIDAVKEYDLHYIKKENILFPYLERKLKQPRCLQLMWSFHDDYRKWVKELDIMVYGEISDNKELIRVLGKLFFVLLPIIFREEQIVFPVAMRTIPEKDWHEMLEQSRLIGWWSGGENGGEY